MVWCCVAPEPKATCVMMASQISSPNTIHDPRWSPSLGIAASRQNISELLANILSWLFYVFKAWKDKTESSYRYKLKLRHDTTKVYVGDHINITSHSGVSSRFVSFRVAECSWRYWRWSYQALNAKVAYTTNTLLPWETGLTCSINTNAAAFNSVPDHELVKISFVLACQSHLAIAQVRVQCTH